MQVAGGFNDHNGFRIQVEDLDGSETITVPTPGTPLKLTLIGGSAMFMPSDGSGFDNISVKGSVEVKAGQVVLAHVGIDTDEVVAEEIPPGMCLSTDTNLTIEVDVSGNRPLTGMLELKGVWELGTQS